MRRQMNTPGAASNINFGIGVVSTNLSTLKLKLDEAQVLCQLWLRVQRVPLALPVHGVFDLLGHWQSQWNAKIES